MGLKVNFTPWMNTFFSDSVFLFYQVTDNKNHLVVLQKCIDDLITLMGIFVKEELPLRGGMAYGDVIAGQNILIGKPVIRAVQNEGLIDAPLILLPASELLDNSLLMYGHRPKLEDIDLKNNESMRGKLISSFPKDDYIELILKKYEHYVVNGPYQIAPKWDKANKFITKHKERIHCVCQTN